MGRIYDRKMSSSKNIAIIPVNPPVPTLAPGQCFSWLLKILMDPLISARKIAPLTRDCYPNLSNSYFCGEEDILFLLSSPEFMKVGGCVTRPFNNVSPKSSN